MTRSRWLVGLQILVWCICVPPLPFIFARYIQNPLFFTALTLVLIVFIAYFFNFKIEDTGIKNIKKFFIYLIFMTLLTTSAGWTMFWAFIFYRDMTFGSVL